MNRTRPYLNKYTKHKELQITDTYHHLNLKEIKPITSRLMEHSESVVINRSKQEQLNEVRNMEIGRENKLLLMKIESVMHKKSSYSKPEKRERMRGNHSLNEIFRKKQEEVIVQENRRFLQRLQNKKPTLDLQKLQRDWKDNKSVIKRMAHYQFYLTNYKESLTKSVHASEKTAKSKLESIRLQRSKVINGHMIIIKIEYVDEHLKITGDTLNNRSLKVILIPKEDALLFLEHDCKGRPGKIFEKLQYDSPNDLLYIVSSLEEEANPQERRSINKKKRLEPIMINSQPLESSMHNQGSNYPIDQEHSHTIEQIETNKVEDIYPSIEG